VDQEVSNYYLTKEVAGTYRGMMIAIPLEHWGAAGPEPVPFSWPALLKRLAKKIDLEKTQEASAWSEEADAEASA